MYSSTDEEYCKSQFVSQPPMSIQEAVCRTMYSRAGAGNLPLFPLATLHSHGVAFSFCGCIVLSCTPIYHYMLNNTLIVKNFLGESC